MSWQNNNQRCAIIIAILASVIVGGGTAVITKIALKEIPAFSFTFLRFAFASLSILPFLINNKIETTKSTYKIVLFSLFMTANVILFPLGVHLTTATIASMLYVFAPILVAILSFFFLAEKFSSKKIIGILTGLVGALVIILLPQIDSSSPFNGNLEGNLIVSIAVISTAIYTVVSKIFQKKYPPIYLTCIFILTSLIFLIPLAASDLLTHPQWWEKLSLTIWASTIYVGILGTTLWYFLNQYIIKHATPLVASSVLYLQPASTFLWASILLDEKLTVGIIAGALLIFIGIYLTLELKPKPKT